ncbi:MAG: PorP/SprF family type IX secretion system membrane protein [Tenuifilaceae bacterium]|jgi:type IX secretion system PorP/SprF family membrane protein|nr:PorP/SprF family type IX secretion system membrane protein [Tenuifilaceae bacterium]
MLKQTITILVPIIILGLIPDLVKGQDPGLSQFYSTPLYLNPAYAGTFKYRRLGLVYRNQWSALGQPYATYGISYDQEVKSIKSGLGINVLNDMQGNGALNRISVDFIYSYGVQVGYRSHVRGGLQASLIQKSQNLSGLTFPDMLDPTGTVTQPVSASPTNSLVPDFSVGIAGDWDMFYGGMVVHHLTEPVDSRIGGTKTKIERKYTLHVGCEINLYQRHRFKDKFLFSPNIIYLQQGDFRQLNIGATFTRLNIVAGLWFRENLDLKGHTFVVVAGYSNDQFRIGYSYDFSLLPGGFRGLETSTHEVTFGLYFEYKQRKRKFRYMKCPKF